MNLRMIVGGFLAGGLVLGAANSATGQVWLDAPLLDVSLNEDRYGGYEPVELDEAKPDTVVEGPFLAAQSNDWIQPPGQIVAQPGPTLISPRPDPVTAPVPQAGPSLAPPTTVNPSLLPGPPVMSPPVAHGYGYGMPVAPQPRRSCPPWRPCGPDESFGGNWLIMQGFFGADFRPACANHDACLMSGCYSRKACDRMYLANLDAACQCSRFPILCRIKARECYLGVRLFGWMY